MTLEEDLKARTLALISQQMATWVVEIQRRIGEHQETLVRSLDELQEMVARYDERINEADIAQSMAEVLASQPPPRPVGPGFPQLKASLSAIEKGTSLSEVLMYLVNEVAQYVDRAAMFIIKGTSAIGWYGRGVQPPEAVKAVNVPLGTDTIFRLVQNARHTERGHIGHTPGTAQALTRLGGNPQGILAVPLILRDKLAAILYCDTTQDEVPETVAGLIEILVMFAGKTIDMLSLAPRAAVGKTTSAGTSAERAAAIRAGGEEVRERAGVPRAAAPPPPAPAAAAPPSDGASTVMFSPSTFAAARPTAVAPPPAPAPPTAPPPGLSAEEQKAHEDAKRFARLVVSEIKLYNETKVNDGRRNKDIYERLKEDIERGRQMYTDRVSSRIRESTNYFYDELVRILAGGDAGALGPM